MTAGSLKAENERLREENERLRARIEAALALHKPTYRGCETCRMTAPCTTDKALKGGEW